MYTPPARSTIETQIITKYENELGTKVPLMKRALVRIIAKSVSGPLWLLHWLIVWAMKQIFIQLMDDEYLQYLADWYGLPRKSATTAILTTTVAGTSGTVLVAGTLATFNGLVFSARKAATITGDGATVEIECLTAGIGGNIEIGSELSFPSPLLGVTSMTVTDISVEGEDQEAIDDWRARIWARMQTAPQGGAIGDYIRWACEVSGIVTAYVKRSDTDVYVYPLADTTGTARVPNTAKITETETYLQDPIRRPLCATVYVKPTTERTISASITGLSPNDDTTKANILSAFNKYIYAAYPKQYSDEVNSTETVSAGGVWAIVIANGAIATAISLTVSGIGAGTPSYALPVGEIAAPGGIIWG
jgi:uncharacterized phage protein gp47/JayE